MLILHLIAFREKERNTFPTPDELCDRMGLPLEAVTDMLRRLVKQEWIYIEERVDPQTGVQYERYSLAPLYRKLAAHIREREDDEASGSGQASAPVVPAPAATAKDIYAVFEKEFARPLSPMEGETISGWLDQDGYAEELILLALKEAVFAGKLNFRYIDRILLEWQRNRIRTAEEAKAFTKQFRTGR